MKTKKLLTEESYHRVADRAKITLEVEQKGKLGTWSKRLLAIDGSVLYSFKSKGSIGSSCGWELAGAEVTAKKDSENSRHLVLISRSYDYHITFAMTSRSEAAYFIKSLSSSGATVTGIDAIMMLREEGFYKCPTGRKSLAASLSNLSERVTNVSWIFQDDDYDDNTDDIFWALEDSISPILETQNLFDGNPLGGRPSRSVSLSPIRGQRSSFYRKEQDKFIQNNEETCLKDAKPPSNITIPKEKQDFTEQTSHHTKDASTTVIPENLLHNHGHLLSPFHCRVRNTSPIPQKYRVSQRNAVISDSYSNIRLTPSRENQSVSHISPRYDYLSLDLQTGSTPQSMSKKTNVSHFQPSSCFSCASLNIKDTLNIPSQYRSSYPLANNTQCFSASVGTSQAPSITSAFAQTLAVSSCVFPEVPLMSFPLHKPLKNTENVFERPHRQLIKKNAHKSKALNSNEKLFSETNKFQETYQELVNMSSCSNFDVSDEKIASQDYSLEKPLNASNGTSTVIQGDRDRGTLPKSCSFYGPYKDYFKRIEGQVKVIGPCTGDVERPCWAELIAGHLQVYPSNSATPFASIRLKRLSVLSGVDTISILKGGQQIISLQFASVEDTSRWAGALRFEADDESEGAYRQRSSSEGRVDVNWKAAKNGHLPLRRLHGSRRSTFSTVQQRIPSPVESRDSPYEEDSDSPPLWSVAAVREKFELLCACSGDAKKDTPLKAHKDSLKKARKSRVVSTEASSKPTTTSYRLIPVKERMKAFEQWSDSYKEDTGVKLRENCGSKADDKGASVFEWSLLQERLKLIEESIQDLKLQLPPEDLIGECPPREGSPKKDFAVNPQPRIVLPEDSSPSPASSCSSVL